MDARGVNLVATLGTTMGDVVGAAVTAASGLSGAAPPGLAVLLAEPGMGVDGFARTVGVTSSGGVRLVDRLAAAGLVQRRAGRDGRAVSLWLTPAGTAAAERMLTARRAAVELLVASLDPAEQLALVGMAERILAAATADREQAEWLCRLCDVAACPARRCPVEQAVS